MAPRRPKRPPAGVPSQRKKNEPSCGSGSSFRRCSAPGRSPLLSSLPLLLPFLPPGRPRGQAARPHRGAPRLSLSAGARPRTSWTNQSDGVFFRRLRGPRKKSKRRSFVSAPSASRGPRKNQSDGVFLSAPSASRGPRKNQSDGVFFRFGAFGLRGPSRGPGVEGRGARMSGEAWRSVEV